MTVAQRERFLAETRNGVLSIAEPGGGTVASPVWFLYAPGADVTFHLNDPSRKLQALEQTGRATVTVQDEGDITGSGRAPRYVSVTGPVVENRTFDPDADGAELWSSIRRYLGEDVGRRYLARGGEAHLTGESSAGLPRVIRIRPERWFTRDYGNAGRRWDDVVGKPDASVLNDQGP